MSGTIVYEIEKNLYLNITNRCTNECKFCIRSKTDKLNNQYELWLEKDPSIDEIKSELIKKDIPSYSEVVFCGFGEPLTRLNLIKELSIWLKANGAKVIRVDTNGQANIYNKKDITPELNGIIDKVSISLNAQDAKTYQALCASEYGEQSYNAMLSFAEKIKNHVKDVQFSVVNLPEVDINKCQKIANNLEIPLKIRSYYEQDYSGFEN